MRARLVLLALGLASTISAPARAQPEGPVQDARDTARALAEEGLDLMDRGQLERGIDKLMEAEALFHAPTHHLFIARAWVQLGKLRRAQHHYEILVAEVIPNYAPDAFREAQGLGRQELLAVEPRVPRLRIVVTGAEASEVVVDVDGERVQSLKVPILVDPGGHHVVATIAGQPPRSSDATVSEGEERTVTFQFGAPASAASPVVPAESDGSSPRLVPAVLAFGVGAAGITVGSVAGLLSLERVADLEARCPTKQCAPEDRGLADDARDLGTLSTAGFVLGGVGVAAGVAIVLWPSKSRTAGAPASSAWSMRPWPGGMMLEGQF